MRKILITLGIACTAVLGSVSPHIFAAQAPVTITMDREISTDVPDVPHAESAIATNPHDPNNILASSFALEDARIVTVLYYTKDGGRTWKRGLFPGPEHTHGINAWDDELAFGEDGTGYYIYESQGIGFLVASTRDGGATWTAPRIHKGIFGYDRSYAAVGRGLFAGRLTIQGVSMMRLGARHCDQIVAASSDDGGLTFNESRSASADQRDGCVASPMHMISAANGALYTFAYVAYGSKEDPSASGDFLISPSFDGGLSFLPYRKIIGYNESGKAPLRSNDRARKPLAKSIFNIDLAGTALDESHGKYRNRLYMAFADWNGQRFLIKAIHSTTDWAHWSKPVIVSDDRTYGNAVLPQAAVNRDGVLAVTWNDRRNAVDNECYQLAAAVSYDGGKTFSRNYLHPGLTCASNLKNLSFETLNICGGEVDPYYGIHFDILIGTSLGGKWPNGGDTEGLAANPDGSFGVVWGNGASGDQQLWYTAFRPAGAALAHAGGRVVAALPRAIGGEPRYLNRARSEGMLDGAFLGYGREPEPALQVAPVGSNVNAALRFEYASAFDRRTSIISFTVRMRNTVPHALKGPFYLEFLRPKRPAPFDSPMTIDYPSTSPQYKGYWRLTTANSDNILEPNETTMPVTIRWRVPRRPTAKQIDTLVAEPQFDVTRSP